MSPLMPAFILSGNSTFRISGVLANVNWRQSHYYLWMVRLLPRIGVKTFLNCCVICSGALSELPARIVDPAFGAAAAWNMLMYV